jgi:hypothetical protein
MPGPWKLRSGCFQLPRAAYLAFLAAAGPPVGIIVFPILWQSANNCISYTMRQLTIFALGRNPENIYAVRNTAVAATR